MLSSISTLFHSHSSLLSERRHLINYVSRNNSSFSQHPRSNRGPPSPAHDTFHRIKSPSACNYLRSSYPRNAWLKSLLPVWFRWNPLTVYLSAAFSLGHGSSTLERPEKRLQTHPSNLGPHHVKQESQKGKSTSVGRSIPGIDDSPGRLVLESSLVVAVYELEYRTSQLHIVA